MTSGPFYSPLRRDTRSERCEWDPQRNIPAREDGGCDNAATLSVGVKDNWHLCASCAGLPRFKRMRKRVALKGAPKP